MAKQSASSFSKRRWTVLAAIGIFTVVAVIVGLTVPTQAGGSNALSKLLGNDQCMEPCVPGSEDIMDPKTHGTSEYPVVSLVEAMKNDDRVRFVFVSLFVCLFVCLSAKEFRVCDRSRSIVDCPLYNCHEFFGFCLTKGFVLYCSLFVVCCLFTARKPPLGVRF
jgi:hypothetical protein